MASEEISLVLSQNHNHQNQHPLFHHTAGNPTANNKTTRELTGFIDHQPRHFQQPQQATSGPVFHQWSGRNGPDSSSPSANGSDSDDDDNDDDDDVEIKNVNGKRARPSSIGNDVNINNDVRLGSVENDQQGQMSQYQNANAITVADPTGEMYYSQYVQGVEGSGAGLKDTLVDNGCGFSGRKDVSSAGGSGESLRAILSDPLTGDLMDDAMILPCGHSFGSSGMEHVMRMKACSSCAHPVSESAVAPNLTLRSAVHAFLREEESQIHRASKRRNRPEQDRSNYSNSAAVDHSRGRGVQFPFFVTERVIIKGNKRTPPRFVGREAIVTTQCLNGWYVVKTLDNAESVKLQYRSLAKIPDSQPSNSNIASSKTTTPNWL